MPREPSRMMSLFPACLLEMYLSLLLTGKYKLLLELFRGLKLEDPIQR